MVYDVAVIGAGIAGMTAAIYALRAGKSVVIFEKESIGGQIALSPKVENYPGFKDISGLDLANNIFEQAMALGAELEVDEVRSIERADGFFRIESNYGVHDAKAVVIAAGLKHRKLDSVTKLEGHGVSYCAVCDGMFYKGKTVAVVGGGNTAVTEAIYLSDICEKVYLIHRRTGYRAEKAVMERLYSKANITRLENRVVSDSAKTENGITLTLASTVGEADEALTVDGVFVALGHIPQNSPFAAVMDLDEYGFAASDERCLTRTPGVFVAGDCREKAVRQLTTAAADGAAAGLAASKYVDGL